MPTGTPRLIALDWGTSSLRAYLMGAGAEVLDQRAEPWGIMQVGVDGFAGCYAAITSGWPAVPALASGMVGSAQGWVEAPYCPSPAGPAELAARLVAVPGTSLQIVPGVMQDSASPDVMRGEETQIAGALALRPALHARARLVMPGTHCKWVDVADGRIAGFTTYMTGEVFAVLRQHSILGRLTQTDAFSPAAFRRGVDAARDAGNGLAGLLFSARSLVLTGRMPAEDSVAYLSGVLIGDEIRNALHDPSAPLTLIGDAALAGRYRDAMARFGVGNVDVLDNTAPAGLWRIARDAGLLPDVASKG